jgi:hypothetical protein
MSENIPVNTTEPKIEQVENKTGPATPKPEEPAPEIKTEENKANWKAFREQREIERKAKEASDKRASEKAAEAEALRAALEAITNKPSNIRQTNDNTYDDNEETEEQRIDKRVELAIKQREAIQEKQRQERELREAPERIMQTYPDFNKVVSTENCDYLDYHYPELTAPFKYMPEGYEKWAAMYRAVKKFVPNADSKQDMNRAEKNLAKPGSISSAGNTHGGNAMPAARLTEERKRENWSRMERDRKGLR